MNLEHRNSHESENNQEANEAKIREAKSFEELYDVIKAIGEIPGRAHTYGSDELIYAIEQVREGKEDEGVVTRTYGIRDAVRALLSELPTGSYEAKKHNIISNKIPKTPIPENFPEKE